MTKQMSEFIEKIESAADKELELLLIFSNSWAWPQGFGKKPFLYDYMANYPKQATAKKRWSYLRAALFPHFENGSLKWEQMSRWERCRLLWASVSPVYKSTFLDPRRDAIKKELRRRKGGFFY